jgi:surfactin synthase thioesterase subunit
LKSLAPAQQRNCVAAFLAEQAAAVLRLEPADKLDPEKSLVEMGMDSMMGVEFLYRINRGLKINLPGQKLLEDPYLSPLAEDIVALLGDESAPAAAASDVAAATQSAQPVSDNAWLPYLVSRPGARARLFCFHGAGNTAAAFADWAGRLPAEIEVCPVELPGYGARAAEAPIADPHALLETLCDVLLDHLDRPFALFGHADGAALALQIACQLQDRFGLAPARLFLAASAPPAATVQGKLDCPVTVFWPQSESTQTQDDPHQWNRHTTGDTRIEPLPAGEADYLSNADDLLRIIASELHDALTQ